VDYIVGASGLVGSTYLRAHQSTAVIRREELYQDDGILECERLVIAAPSAEKWLANSQPQTDWAEILRLGEAIKKRFAAREVLVFSTVDVYPLSTAPDEATDPRPAEPYGRHRKWLADYISSEFNSTTVIRLPGLFGSGLKKNPLFDIVNRRDDYISRLHPNSEYQWVPIGWAIAKSEDFMTGVASVVNLVSEPVAIQDLEIFGSSWKALLNSESPIIRYGVRTMHAASGYFLGSQQVVEMVREWSKKWTVESKRD
jgi:hypothetical protein